MSTSSRATIFFFFCFEGLTNQHFAVKSPCHPYLPYHSANSRHRHLKPRTSPQPARHSNSIKTPGLHQLHQCLRPQKRVFSLGPAKTTRSHQSNRSQDQSRPYKAYGSPKWVSNLGYHQVLVVEVRGVQLVEIPLWAASGILVPVFGSADIVLSYIAGVVHLVGQRYVCSRMVTCLEEKAEGLLAGKFEPAILDATAC